MKFSFYCACGGSASGSATPDAKVAKIEAVFRQAHSDPGCRPCDAKTARAARKAGK